jgi:tripartite-type tricarboxylate transporter receptor subunit TctC
MILPTSLTLPTSLRSSLRWGIAALVLCAGVGPAAAAEPYPTRPIRLVVGFLAGGPTDIPARFLADRLSAKLGQPIVVENKPGAGGMIALNDVLAQPRDGYTLQLCTYFDAINTLLYKNVSYKLDDIAPVTLISKYYYLMTLAKSVPVDTFPDFVRYAKAHPGEILYGTVGAGSTQELVGHELEKIANIRMTKVPFKGSNQITQEMLAGRIHFQVGPPIAIAPFYKSGELKVIAVTGPERLKSLPEIPTLVEQGFDLKPYAWLGVCAGAGTPKSVIDLLNRNIRSIVESDEYRDFLDKAGNIPAATTPEEFRQVLIDTVNDAAPFIREFKMQIE